MSRTIMAFDFGTKSIGSAIGQEVTGTASPLKAFKANDGIPNWDEIEKQIKEYPHLYFWTHNRFKHKDKAPKN